MDTDFTIWHAFKAAVKDYDASREDVDVRVFWPSEHHAIPTCVVEINYWLDDVHGVGKTRTGYPYAKLGVEGVMGLVDAYVEQSREWNS